MSATSLLGLVELAQRFKNHCVDCQTQAHKQGACTHFFPLKIHAKSLMHLTPPWTVHFAQALFVPDIPFKLELSLLCLCSIDLTDISHQSDFYPHSLCLSWDLETAPSRILYLQQGSGFGLTAPFLCCISSLRVDPSWFDVWAHSSYPCALLAFAGFKLTRNTQHNSRQARHIFLQSN